MLPAWKIQAGLDADYAWRPLVLTDRSPVIQSSRKTSYDLIGHAVGADLTLALGVGARTELALLVPVTLYQAGETVPGATTPAVMGLHNPLIGAKARLVGGGAEGFGLGASLLVSIPVGAGGALIHDDGLGGEARLFAGYRAGTGRGSKSFALGGGYRLRNSARLYDVTLGDEIVYAAAAALRAFPQTVLFGELAGATAAASPFGSPKQSPMEVLFGGRHRLDAEVAGGHVWLTGAVGPGLMSGYGSPTLRAVVGLAWSNKPLDDLPPRAAEPPPPPPKPKCPGDPGCPPVPPPKPPTPPGDRDKDGVLDDADECPDEPEDKDGFEDEDGCPDPDNDSDGIPDGEDKCPNEPETINGKDDEDGCPDKGDVEVRIGKEELETLRPVFFDTDRSRVRHAFYNILGQVALTLKAHPEIGRCAVEGHTDDTGPPQWNQKLSVLRAEAVIEFLVGKGVDRKRLYALGHGEKVPWMSNATESGRAKNRRVIFHIEGANPEDQQRQERRKRVRARKAAGAAKVEKVEKVEKAPAAAPVAAPAPAEKPTTPTTTGGTTGATGDDKKPSDKPPTLRELLKLPDRR